jgi:hypothetical protein
VPSSYQIHIRLGQQQHLIHRTLVTTLTPAPQRDRERVKEGWKEIDNERESEETEEDERVKNI